MTNPSSEEDEGAGWTIGHMEDVDGHVSYIEGRELSHQQIADYREAVGFVVEYQDQPALRLVVGNYREYRALEAAMAMALTTQTVQAAFPPGEHLFQLRRALLNWLRAVRFLDDYTSARLTRTYGKESRELKRYAAARAAAYDNVASYSYRFVCQLRHYAQHCGMVPVQGQIHIDGTGRNLELYFDRDELLAKLTNPSEACTARATTLCFFPHQEGVAFVFGCDEHALALGRWAGQRFGGCFGDSVFKAPSLMEQANNRFARVDLPHGADFDHLLPVSDPPQIQSPLT